ncbi:hypothetical protein [uncultured Ruegeria sp.]|nr:hypothetical protein [uncultured Ruegeria sp.]
MTDTPHNQLILCIILAFLATRWRTIRQTIAPTTKPTSIDEGTRERLRRDIFYFIDNGDPSLRIGDWKLTLSEQRARAMS